MKVMYIAKRVRHDVLPAVIFLSSRVKQPTTQDWAKLKKDDEIYFKDEK